MNKTATRALRATAAFAGLATAFSFSGTALAATPGDQAPSQLPSDTAALSNAGATTAGFTAPTALPSTSRPSVDQLHSFALPRTAPADRSDDSDSDADGLPSPEHASSSDKYSRDNDRTKYVDDSRDNKEQLRKAEANHEIGPAKCSSDPGRSGGYGYGYNGDPDRDDPSSDDYDPDCTGYHASEGANAQDNDNYYGTEPGRRKGKSDVLGGLI
jgi:hypothetical protein